MNIRSIKNAEDSISFAQEEFTRRDIDWSQYTLESNTEITKELIQKLKLRNNQPGWILTFVLKLPEGFEIRYLFLHIYPLLGTCEIVQHC